MSNAQSNADPIRVGLMGFGRIGRNIYRLAAEKPDVEIAVISDVADPRILHYLLQRDSIHGSFLQKDPWVVSPEGPAGA